MWRWFLVLIVAVVLVGCSSDDQEPEATKIRLETAAPTSFLAGYSGPLLRTPDPNIHDGDCSIDDPDGACGISVSGIQENAPPLPLVLQNVAGVMMGVPESFQALESGVDRIIIETDDVETYPGDFFVIVERGTADEVDSLLNRYAGLDYDRRVDFQNESGTLTGYRLPNGDLGMVIVIELDSDADMYMMMQGIVVSGYWPKYEATFIEMARSVELPSS
jgi:hypothetical protein